MFRLKEGTPIDTSEQVFYDITDLPVAFNTALLQSGVRSPAYPAKLGSGVSDPPCQAVGNALQWGYLG